MAKIKSTLDLVMERTRNLSMTQEERERLRAKEETEKVRAWVQKYLHGRVNEEEMKSVLDERSDIPSADREILRSELIDNIRPDQDNTRILRALERIFDIPSESVDALLGNHRTYLASQMPSYLEQCRADLKQQGFSGSSVVPNLAQSRRWQDFAREAQEDLRRRISSLRGNGTSNPR